MGNSSSKDTPHGGRFDRRGELAEHGSAPSLQQTPSDRLVATVYGPESSSRRGSRHEISFLHIGRDRNNEAQSSQKPRETRQEKEARRAERERQTRLKERDRSVREEHVDGGFLVTLGTYTGPEDFSKPIVRQLQIERRLAPFWRGLNDHSDSWTEHQLVAAVRGLPIPAADEIPPEMSPSQSNTVSPQATLGQTLSVPSPEEAQSRTAPQLSSSHPTTSSSSPLSPLSASPLFRGRSKTLASLTGGGKTMVPDLTPQEIQLPKDPNVNGLPIEAYLYREPGECPICFLYYPPYLNKTRCCDQPICSECFVQIKRPDPHPPEHEQPGEPRRPEEDAEMLVSEVAACPFCVAPEFGITYEPPPFRRGLAYANQNTSSNVRTALSAASSQTSFQSGERRRTISISATAPEVVTTDRVRPDWAKKLSDARAHALRRSAAATALHNAAYVLGNQESLFRGGYGRRRRSMFVESSGGSGSHTPGDAGDGSGDLFPGRTSSRRNRVEDLEDLMMMEAIRLSLAAEEERKRKEDKEKAKEDKKKAKEAKKEAKQLEKLAKKGGSSTSLYRLQSNDSTSTWATSSMARSTSNLGSPPPMPEGIQGKGKAPAVGSPYAPNVQLDQNRPTSATTTTGSGQAQRHLEESRANIQPAGTTPIPMPGRRLHPRQLSNASSIASSFVDSPSGSIRADSPSPNGSGFEGLSTHDEPAYRSGTPPVAAGSLEPMLNFRSLAAMIDDETKKAENEHVEHAPQSSSLARAEEEVKEPLSTVSPAASITFEVTRERGDSGESSTAPPIREVTTRHDETYNDDKTAPDVQLADHGHFQATQ